MSESILSYMEIRGEETGKLISSCKRSGRVGMIEVLDFFHKIENDGEVVFNPFTFSKKRDRTTPQLVQMCITKETGEALLNLYRINEKGIEEHFFTVKFGGIKIIEVEQYKAADSGNGDGESIMFSYDSIVHTHEIAGRETNDELKRYLNLNK